MKNLKQKMFLLVASLLSVGSSLFAAPISYDSATNSFTGAFDLGPFGSAVAIMVVAIAVIASVKLAIGLIRRA